MSEINKIISDVNIQQENTFSKPGYIEIYTSDLATKGIFYHPDLRIFIRSADVREVKHWSTINENDPIAIDEGLNYILSKCVEVICGKNLMSYRDLCQEDRFQIILMIRDLTYPEPESKIQVNAECQECQTKCNIDLNSRNIKTTKPVENLLDRYDAEKRSFVLKTKSFGNIEFKAPTIANVAECTRLVKEMRNNGKKIDSTFISILPYLADKLNKDKISQLEKDFITWEPKKLSFYVSIIKEIKFLSQESGLIDLGDKCSKCGSEVSAPLTFPNGIKSLFIIQNWASELL